MESNLASLSAIARMQYRAFLNSMRRGGKRDPLPTALGILVSISTTVFALLIGATLAFAFANFDALEPPLHFWLITGVGISSAVFASLSAISGEANGVADARSLQVFPLTRAALTRLDLLSEFLAPSILMFTPGFAGLAAGVFLGQLLAGRPLAGLAGAVAIGVTFVCNVTLVRIVSSWITTSGRRLREWVTLLFVTGFVAVAYLGPEIDHVREASVARAEGVASVFVRATWIGAAADLSVAGGATSSAALLSKSAPGWILDVLILGVWLAVLLGVHARLTRRLLAGEGGHHERARARPIAGPVRRGVLERVLRPAVFGIAASDLRSILRIPMMWILLFMPALFGIFAGGRGLGGANPGAMATAAAWALPAAALGAHILFSSQLFSNMFGIDRDAAAHFLLAPVSARELFLGKGLARIAFGSIQVLAFLSTLALRNPVVGRSDVLRAYGAWLAAALWVSSIGMLLSIRMPVRMTFGQQREQRFERAATSFIAQLCVAVVLLPPAAMILGGRLLRGDSGYLAGTITTAVAGAILWWAASWAAADLLAARGPDMVDALSLRG